MSLLGQGFVAIWNGIAPEGREEFYEWHNREHMPERVGIPGFIRGRRYIAKYGHPEYFTLYEAVSPEVLSGQDYFNRLNNPTPWTKRVPPAFFRDTSRGICRVKFSSACGDGGYLLTLQFGPAPGREAGLEKALRHDDITAADRCARSGRSSLRHRRCRGERRGNNGTRGAACRHSEMAYHDRGHDAPRQLMQPAIEFIAADLGKAWRNGRSGPRPVHAAKLSREKRIKGQNAS